MAELKEALLKSEDSIGLALVSNHQVLAMAKFRESNQNGSILCYNILFVGRWNQSFRV